MSAPPPGNSFLKLALIGALLAAVAAGAYYYFAQQAEKGVVPVDEAKTLRTYLAAQNKFDKLDPAYADADGDLVADPPADKSKLVSPAELVFSGLYQDDPAKAEAEYKPLMEAISKAAGKPVKYTPPPPPAPVGAAASADGEEAVGGGRGFS